MKGVWVDPEAKRRTRTGGCALGRRRPRDAGARPRRARRADLAHRHRRADARRRNRLALPPARPDDRQPALRRSRHRRRAARDARRRPSTRTSSGACAAAPATSASSSPSSTGCTRSARSCSAARSSTSSTMRQRRSGMRASSVGRARRGFALARAHTRATGPAVPARSGGVSRCSRLPRSAPTSSAGRRSWSRSPHSGRLWQTSTARSPTRRCSPCSTCSIRTATGTGRGATTSPSSPTARSRHSSPARGR